MTNEKFTPSKPTETITAKATTEPVKATSAVTTTATSKVPESANVVAPVKTDTSSNPAESIKTGLETGKTVSDTIAAIAQPEIKAIDSITVEKSEAEKLPDVPAVVAPTKMGIATEIYKRMKIVKGITRKEILDAFVAEAKLSKAGASTYYQLIKAKVK